MKLDVADVAVEFDGVSVLDGVGLHCESREILGLIGPNGAGKTTLVDVITGFRRAPAKVSLDEVDVTGWSPARRARAGIIRTFQGARVFAGLSVFENVLAAAQAAGSRGRAAKAKAAETVERFGLAPVASRKAGEAPYGIQRRIAIARAVACDPSMLLLDEPAAGLNATESRELAQALDLIRREIGCGIVLIEHDMPLVMSACDRVQVIASGKLLAEGAPEEVRRQPDVIEAYLGSKAATS